MASGQVRAEKAKNTPPGGEAAPPLCFAASHLACASLMTTAYRYLMWCEGKSDNLVTIGWGDLVVFRSQVGGSNNVVHVEVVVLSYRRHISSLTVENVVSTQHDIVNMPACCFELEYASLPEWR